MNTTSPMPQESDEKAPRSVSYDVPPVTRAMALLRYIAAGNRCRNIAKASAAVGINRATLIRLLHTLEREEMIEKTPEGDGYVLGYGVLELASGMLSSRDVVRTGRPVLHHLAAETGLSAHLGVLAGTDVIVLVRETPEVQLVSNIRVGSRLPAYATVMGRVILSHMREDEVRNIFYDYNFSAFTDQTPTTVDSLLGQLKEDRAAGIAWSVAFFEEGIGSCACVVLDQNNAPVCAISLSGPQANFEEGSEKRQQIMTGVVDAARRLSAMMGHIPTN